MWAVATQVAHHYRSVDLPSAAKQPALVPRGSSDSSIGMATRNSLGSESVLRAFRITL